MNESKGDSALRMIGDFFGNIGNNLNCDVSKKNFNENLNKIAKTFEEKIVPPELPNNADFFLDIHLPTYGSAGGTVKLPIYMEKDPKNLATNFVEKYNLEKYNLEKLTTEITRAMKKYREEPEKIKRITSIQKISPEISIISSSFENMKKQKAGNRTLKKNIKSSKNRTMKHISR